MKHRIFWLLLFCGASLTAAPRVALLNRDGESANLADLTTSALSDEFSFLERNRLDLLRKELRITTLFGAENTARQARLDSVNLFALLESAPNGQITLTVFETDCGFRLAQLPLATKPETAISQIRTALNNSDQLRQNPDQLRLVTFAGIRENISEQQKKAAQREARLLLRRLPELPIILMERDHLLELLQERRLTGNWFDLAVGAELLLIELNPGKDSRQILISAFVQLPDSTTLLDVEAASAQELHAKLAAYFATTPPARRTGTRITEANRFLEEAERADSYAVRAEKEFVAYALNPSLELLRRQTNYLNHKPGINIFLLEEYASHPEYLPNDIYLLHSNWWQELKRTYPQFPPAMQARYRHLLEQREVFLTPMANFESPGLKELVRLCRTRPELYLTDQEWESDYQQAWDRALNSLREFNPSIQPPLHKSTFGAWLSPLTEVINCKRSRLKVPESGAYYMEIAEQLEATGHPLFRVYAPWLRAQATLFQTEYDHEISLAAFREFLMVCRREKISPAQILWLPSDLFCFLRLKTAVSDLEKELFPNP